MTVVFQLNLSLVAISPDLNWMVGFCVKNCLNLYPVPQVYKKNELALGKIVGHYKYYLIPLKLTDHTSEFF